MSAVRQVTPAASVTVVCSPVAGAMKNESVVAA
jgi:hypothetical protein